MSYSTDKPITSEKEDVLGRRDFSKRLGRLIYNYQGEDGLVLGLYGEWGSGKTSVINMVEEAINGLAEKAREEVRKKAEEGKVQSPSEGDRKEDENEPLIIRFSPWHYSDNDNLISLFFQSLKNKIDKNEALKKSLGKTLNDYVSVFNALSFVLIPGSEAVAKIVQQQIKASYEKKANLDSTKKALEKALKKVKKKIVIVIDDIDRLTNTQIKDIFQLVKSVGDLPYIIYILAMDREIVERALTEVHQTDGGRYLEKIIQMPIELPRLSKSGLEKILESKLDDVRHSLPSEVVWNKEYYQEVLNNCVRPYITTLRDVNRLINVFQFRYGMLYEEVSFEDMLGLTTLEVFEPKLYRWIYGNKTIVCKGVQPKDFTTKAGYFQLYSDRFINMGINSNRAMHCIGTMFPAFAYDVDDIKNPPLKAYLKSMMRVGDEEKFELYFAFNLETIKVPRSLIKACLFEYDEAKLSKVLEEINQKGNIIYFLEESISLLDDIDYKRLKLIASVLFELQKKFGDKYSESREASLYYILELFFFHIVKRFESKEESYKFICRILENINKFGLSMVASIINKIEGAYGRLEIYLVNEGNRIIDLEQLKELENSYVEKIRTIVEVESILEVYKFKMVFNLWYFLDKEGATTYWQAIFKDEIKTLQFICSSAEKWGNGYWSFDLNSYACDISYDELYNTIQSFDKRKLDNFKETEQIQLASFYLGYSKSDMGNITEEEAKKLLNEWKTAQ